MYEFFKISIAGIVLALIIIVLKHIKSEYAVLISVIGCCMIMISVISVIGDIFGIVKDLLSDNGISTEYIEIIFKVCGIGFVSNFAVETCRDSGAGAVASTVETAGRICIVSAVLPLALSLMESVTEIIKTNVF